MAISIKQQIQAANKNMAALFKAGYAFEQASEFHTQHPSLA